LLTLEEIENMPAEDRAKLIRKDYRHLSGKARSRATLLISAAKREIDGDLGEVDVSLKEINRKLTEKKNAVDAPLKFEDLHTRKSYWIRNDLLEVFNNVAGDRRGEKTRMINEAIEDYLRKLYNEK
jgi:hypothetical protein